MMFIKIQKDLFNTMYPEDKKDYEANPENYYITDFLSTGDKETE